MKEKEIICVDDDSADDYILDDIYSQIYATAIKLDADYIKTRNIAFDRNSGEQMNILVYTLKYGQSCLV